MLALRVIKIKSYWLMALLIFGLTLLLRIPMLGSFVTADEPRWIERSQGFAAGLFVPGLECPPVNNGRTISASGLGCTLQVGHPGVTTMWAGTLGLLIYYWRMVRPAGVDLATFLQTPINHLDPILVMWMRLPLAILSSAFIAISYLFICRLLTARVALVAALLLALQPLHIALSRVLHHDALNTTFMMLSILPLMGYWLRGWKWYWLLCSGAMAGLAFLGKPVSWLLWPYVAVLGGFSLFYRPRSIWRLLGEGVLWGGMAMLTFAIFYPAMWVTPGQVMEVMLGRNIEVVEEGHTHYFLGQVSDDPGFWFYPIAWLWQASPLEIIGLMLLLVASASTILRKQLAQRPVEIALLLFLVLLFALEITSSAKMLRYFLPAFPVIAIFAAYGLLWFADRVVGRFWQSRTKWVTPGLAGLIVFVQGGLAVSHFPYYFTYYNPLVGGPAVAARLMTVGWGEGLEQAAAYLNNLPDAKSLVVSSWYSDVFQPYFVGKQASFSDDGRGQLTADYVVFYINQIQRQKPYPGLIDYFRSDKPVFVVNVGPFGWNTDLSDPNAVHWVEVYKAPAAQSAGGAPKVEGVAQLLAYKVTGRRVANGRIVNSEQVSLAPDEVSVVLFLRVLGPLPEGTTFGAALTDGQQWRQWQTIGVKGEWREGQIVEWQGRLTLPFEMPTGDYRLWVALQAQDGALLAEFPLSAKDPPIKVSSTPQLIKE